MSLISFDREAFRYDDSRGYPAVVATAVGKALFELAGGRPGLRALEIGVGTGRIAIPLARAGANVTGIDVSPRMLERLRAKWEAERVEAESAGGALAVDLGNITALPFAAATFDAVIAVHVLHLVADWRGAVDEVLRVLRPVSVFLLGQDRRPESPLNEMQQQWEAIAGELGYEVRRPGAQFDVVIEELRARGLTVDVSVPVTWTVSRTPRWLLGEISSRSSSATWNVPDDIFAESLVRLEAWARERFGGRLDDAVDERVEFQVARAAK
jgi:SAM-dependent methyltransferase